MSDALQRSDTKDFILILLFAIVALFATLTLELWWLIPDEPYPSWLVNWLKQVDATTSYRHHTSYLNWIPGLVALGIFITMRLLWALLESFSAREFPRFRGSLVWLSMFAASGISYLYFSSLV